MDDFVNSFLSSSSWTAVTSLESPAWVGTSALQTNDYRITNEQNSTMSMNSSGQTIQTVPHHESIMHENDGRIPIFVDEDLKYGLNKGMLGLENQLQQDISGNISLPTQQNGHIRRRFTIPASLEDNAVASSFAAVCNPVRSFASEQSVFPQSLEDSHSASRIPQFWPASYANVHSLSRGQNNLQSLGCQQGVVENASNILGRTFSNGEISQLCGFPGALDGKKELPKSHIPSLTPVSDMNVTSSTGTQPRNYQMPPSSNGNFIPITQAEHSPTSVNGLNCTSKPRMRARRGQATDPHSIAERLRREKIADRMKNLQELVPNSNKTDKASMLDEIIDYVKFLQLQVKVLSMSRLGAAGAVVPLITDTQPEGSSNLLLSPTIEFGGTDLSDSQDDIAFEQEVVKLMESNVTMAMQFLQNKGLCLMPVALAAAISARKGSSSAIAKPDSSPDVISQGSETTLKEMNDEQQLPKSCNGSVTILERSQIPSANTKNSKPKA